jgi:ribonuclease R
VLVHRAVKSLLHGVKADTSPAAIETLRASATAASVRERAVMDVEREVVDLYRTLHMRDHIGDVYEGNVTSLVGSGMYVTIDHPFVDVLVRFEALGPDHYQLSDDELSVVGVRSGDTISLGDRVLVRIEDAAVLRRQTFAVRVPPEGALVRAERKSLPVRTKKIQASVKSPRAKARGARAGERGAAAPQRGAPRTERAAARPERGATRTGRTAARTERAERPAAKRKQRRR